MDPRPPTLAATLLPVAQLLGRRPLLWPSSIIVGELVLGSSSLSVTKPADFWRLPLARVDGSGSLPHHVPRDRRKGGDGLAGRSGLGPLPA